MLRDDVEHEASGRAELMGSEVNGGDSACGFWSAGKELDQPLGDEVLAYEPERHDGDPEAVSRRAPRELQVVGDEARREPGTLEEAGRSGITKDTMVPIEFAHAGGKRSTSKVSGARHDTLTRLDDGQSDESLGDGAGHANGEVERAISQIAEAIGERELYPQRWMIEERSRESGGDEATPDDTREAYSDVTLDLSEPRSDHRFGLREAP